MLVDFCLPIKNEEKILVNNIKYLLGFLESQRLNYSWQIILIINGSQDDSYSLAQALAQRDKRIRVKYLELSGKGRALREYFKESLADILVFMDIDLAVSLNNLASLVKLVIDRKADLVIGSRLLPESNTNRSFWRSFVSRQYNNLSRLILRHNFSDLQCGFKACKRSLFNNLQVYFQDNNWFFDTELIVLASRANYKIEEMPVDWQEARYAKRKSKVWVFIDTWVFIMNLFYFKYRLYHIRIDSKKNNFKIE